MAATAIPTACWPPAISISWVETELKTHDIAALIPIITGAAAIVTPGRPTGPARRPHHRRGRSRVHEAALKLLTAIVCVTRLFRHGQAKARSASSR